MTMKSTVMSKRDTQGIIKALRSNGYEVEKIDSGYTCSHEGILVFKAMNGNHGYLCRYNTGVFSF